MGHRLKPKAVVVWAIRLSSTRLICSPLHTSERARRKPLPRCPLSVTLAWPALRNASEGGLPPSAKRAQGKFRALVFAPSFRTAAAAALNELNDGTLAATVMKGMYS
jgi:hypothetical protein